MQDGLWQSLLSSPVPADVLVLTGESMREDDGVDQVRLLLRQIDRPRVVELREYGPDHLLDIEVFAPDTPDPKASGPTITSTGSPTHRTKEP